MRITGVPREWECVLMIAGNGLVRRRHVHSNVAFDWRKAAGVRPSGLMPRLRHAGRTRQEDIHFLLDRRVEGRARVRARRDVGVGPR